MRRLALALVAAALATPAAGYERSAPPGSAACFWWEARTVYYRLNVASATFRAQSCRESGLEDAVRRGFERWSGATPVGQSCTDLSLLLAPQYSTSTTIGLDPRPGKPNENLIVFRRGWCSDLDPADPCWSAPDDAPSLGCAAARNCFDDASETDRTTLALTTVTYDSRTGRILDADVEFVGWSGGDGEVSLAQNGWYYTCSGEEPGPLCGTALTGACCTRYGQEGCHYIDLESVVTHEVGHFIGLAHVPEAFSTMFAETRPGRVSQRSLDPDDVAGLCEIYPAAGPTSRCVWDESSSGCATGAGAAWVAVLLPVIALGGGVVIRRRGRDRG